MYSKQVLSILSGMIVTGATRTVTAKLFYQLGFNRPLCVTLFYLFGQSLSLVVYFTLKHVSFSFGERSNDESKRSGCYAQNDFDIEVCNVKPDDESEINQYELSTNDPVICTNDDNQQNSSNFGPPCLQIEVIGEEGTTSKVVQSMHPSTSSPSSTVKLEDKGNRNNKEHQAMERRNIGSNHGLGEDSKLATIWVHQLPWYTKPVIPAFFNLCNSAMRWASLIYVSSSVAEMLISGFELILSVISGRIFRKRKLSNMRLVGIFVVFVGLLVVGIVEVGSAEEKQSSAHEQIIGIFLIIGQCTLSVLQDLAEEILMQEGEFPSSLLLGLEGLIGLSIGLAFYFPLADSIKENLGETITIMQNDLRILALSIGFIILVTVTGLFNIKATEVTSSITRNVWKNMRTILVWIIGITIFYSTGNPTLGESWLIPASFFILCGFLIIVLGIAIYYEMPCINYILSPHYLFRNKTVV